MRLTGTPMINPLARFPQTFSLTAGALIGLSMVAAGFALTETATVGWQAVLVVAVPVILALGVALHVVIPDRRPGV